MKDYSYKVISTRLITPVIKELILTPLNMPLEYRPGQYILLNDSKNKIPQRSYSIANTNKANGSINLIVTLIPDGQTSNWIHKDLKLGEIVTLSGPYGTFIPEPSLNKPLLFLAAGSGIAPAKAIIESLIKNNYQNNITLFFSARTKADLIKHSQWLNLEKKNDNFKYCLTLTRDKQSNKFSRIPYQIPRLFDNLFNYQVFISGPSGFIISCAKAVKLLGVADFDIFTEEFFSEPQPWTNQP